MIFMANPFSFSQSVFFERETATPINQEARILDFIATPQQCDNELAQIRLIISITVQTEACYAHNVVCVYGDSSCLPAATINTLGVKSN